MVNVAPYAAGAMQFIGNQMDVASHGIWCEAGAQVVGNFFCESKHAPEPPCDRASALSSFRPSESQVSVGADTNASGPDGHAFMPGTPTAFIRFSPGAASPQLIPGIIVTSNQMKSTREVRTAAAGLQASVLGRLFGPDAQRLRTNVCSSERCSLIGRF